MKYTVVWSETAEQQLAQAWLNAELRPLLSKATTAIDARLGRDAPHVGESREGNRRIEFDQPFGVIFECDETARTVKVLFFWSY